MAKKKKVQDIVSNSISNLTIPYIEKYGDKILGVYLCPYQIGGIQRIEVVVLHNNETEIPVIKNQLLVNELKIQVSTKNIIDYRGIINCDTKEKATKDLKNGIVVYDPKHILAPRIRLLEKNESLKKYYNSFELPSDMIKSTKSRIYSIGKRSR